MSHALNTFLLDYGVIALFTISLVKGIGIPIPIPADLVVLAAATGSAGGKLVVWEAFGAVLFGMVGGGLIQFGLARGPARSLLYRFGSRVGLTTGRLDLALERLDHVGVVGIAIVVVTPGIRTAAIPACGLTRVQVQKFAVGLLLGTGLYIAFQFFVAYGFVRFILTRSIPDGGLLWLLLIPVAAALAVLVFQHQTKHLTALTGSVDAEDAVFGSRLCPLCRLTVVADRLARHRATDARSSTLIVASSRGTTPAAGSPWERNP